jgi:hypothetical protein
MQFDQRQDPNNETFLVVMAQVSINTMVGERRFLKFARAIGSSDDNNLQIVTKHKLARFNRKSTSSYLFDFGELQVFDQEQMIFIVLEPEDDSQIIIGDRRPQSIDNMSCWRERSGRPTLLTGVFKGPVGGMGPEYNALTITMKNQVLRTRHKNKW